MGTLGSSWVAFPLPFGGELGYLGILRSPRVSGRRPGWILFLMDFGPIFDGFWEDLCVVWGCFC